MLPAKGTHPMRTLSAGGRRVPPLAASAILGNRCDLHNGCTDARITPIFAVQRRPRPLLLMRSHDRYHPQPVVRRCRPAAG